MHFDGLCGLGRGIGGEGCISGGFGGERTGIQAVVSIVVFLEELDVLTRRGLAVAEFCGNLGKLAGQQPVIKGTQGLVVTQTHGHIQLLALDDVRNLDDRPRAKGGQHGGGVDALVAHVPYLLHGLFHEAKQTTGFVARLKGPSAQRGDGTEGIGYRNRMPKTGATPEIVDENAEVERGLAFFKAGLDGTLLAFPLRVGPIEGEMPPLHAHPRSLEAIDLDLHNQIGGLGRTQLNRLLQSGFERRAKRCGFRLPAANGNRDRRTGVKE